LGDIFSFYKEDKGNWTQGNRVNDVDTIAKEGLTALSADGENAFAVWLDLRGNKHNKIYGAKSTNGGKHGKRILWFILRQTLQFANVVSLQYWLKETMFI